MKIGSQIKTFSSVSTPVVSKTWRKWRKYGESMRKQNIPKSRVSYIFWEKQKSIQFPKLKTWTYWIYLVQENYEKTQIYQRFRFFIYSTLLYFAWNRNLCNFENMGNNWILIVRETYGKAQTFQSYGFLTYFMCGINTYNFQNMRKVDSQSKEKIWETQVFQR